MSFTFRPARRENVSLIVGLAGGTGGGKTLSAMRLATGLAGGERFAVIDTEAGRAKHYADMFNFDHGDLTAPFRPERYDEAIRAADAADYPVIVVDSFSHEWEGDGGMLEWADEEFRRMGGKDAVRMSSWIAPKAAHRKMVTHLLQVRAHLILCFRAAEKVEMVRNQETGKMEVVPKRTRTGLDGWVPITEKALPYELTASFLVVSDSPGVPQPIKLPAHLRPMVALDHPLTEDVGVQLRAWAAGDGSPSGEAETRVADLRTKLLAAAEMIGTKAEVEKAIASNRRRAAGDLDAHATWLTRSLEAARERLAELQAVAQEPLSFDQPAGEEQ